MRLIIINGPVGVGKSSVAMHLHNDFPASVLIDIDELRREIPNYKEHREESLVAAYTRAEEIIVSSLQEGKDVIVEKTISNPEILDLFIEAGRSSKAHVYEIHLYARKEVVQQRADNRGYQMGGLLTKERVGEHWDTLEELRGRRASAIQIDTTDLTPDEVYISVRGAVGFKY